MIGSIGGENIILVLFFATLAVFALAVIEDIFNR